MTRSQRPEIVSTGASSGEANSSIPGAFANRVVSPAVSRYATARKLNEQAALSLLQLRPGLGEAAGEGAGVAHVDLAGGGHDRAAVWALVQWTGSSGVLME